MLQGRRSRPFAGLRMRMRLCEIDVGCQPRFDACSGSERSWEGNATADNRILVRETKACFVKSLLFVNFHVSFLWSSPQRHDRHPRS